jgi:hypothetical protein
LAYRLWIVVVELKKRLAGRLSYRKKNYEQKKQGCEDAQIPVEQQ